MKSIKELREGIDTILKVDGTMRSAAMGITTIDPRMIKPGSEEFLQNMAEENLKEITQKNSAIFQGVLGELAQHDSPEAVKAIKRLFRSNIVPYRLLAVVTLGAMSTPTADKALSVRMSFWSFASKEEKDLAESLLGGDRIPFCISCHKPIRAFQGASGHWVGTLEELSKMKIEPDHGFVCNACNAIICPVCLGNKASELGVREFVCTQCGAKPLKTIYRKTNYSRKTRTKIP